MSRLVLIDGSPLNEPWSQFVDASTALPVNIDDVSRIDEHARIERGVLLNRQCLVHNY